MNLSNPLNASQAAIAGVLALSLLMLFYLFSTSQTVQKKLTVLKDGNFLTVLRGGNRTSYKADYADHPN